MKMTTNYFLPLHQATTSAMPDTAGTEGLEWVRMSTKIQPKDPPWVEYADGSAVQFKLPIQTIRKEKTTWHLQKY